ncbi:MAG: anti-sigma factor family protein [Solirubrobacteraceae bacterium]
MSTNSDNSTLSAREMADLSALADGTIDPARRPEVEAHIAASPELSALYERERRVVEMLHHAAVTDRAPASLRARIEAQRPKPAVQARRRFGYAGALVGGLAALALALALILPGGTPGSPSVSDAAALAIKGATEPAPVPDPNEPSGTIGDGIQDVYFPDWKGHFHAVAVGQRTDGLGGRPAVTVYYRWKGKMVAYTIVGVPALSQPKASVTQKNGVELRTLTIGGRTVVTWRRDGHTCVISGPGLSASDLQRLAAWSEPAQLTS